ncbi:PREDICTED: syntaxin-binding protein 3 [Nanorana parkeri]|uniref:syntaxin-binding protein 3 n=1 Tax=Nanorana parkeri TaxID=125878 RepID=UPI000854B5FD|nr:PREDICTED: syntaxin-binding protein 3 [Nanorana parkeri]
MSAVTDKGLKNTVWQKIKTEILDDCKKENEWKILVLDEFTTKLLTSCCKMTDLLQEGITVVEDIYKKRQPVPDLKAIYFISPTEKSIEILVNDCKAKQCKYKTLYVYFSDTCPDSLFARLKSCAPKSIKKCKEVNISFFPRESQVFLLDLPDAFHLLYSPDKSVNKESAMHTIAQQLVTLCATLDENPGVRYKRDPMDNAEDLANLVEEKLVQYYKIDEKDQFKGKTPAQLLILDRGFDPVSTLLHELTFQAMIYDLLPIEDDVYKYQTDTPLGIKDKEGRLDESDELWAKIRHKHIADVLEELPKLVKEISSAKKETDGKVILSNLSNLMKKMPHIKKQMNKQTLHINLAEDCMQKYKGNLEKLCKVEQDLALGKDAEGQKVKEHMRVLLPVLMNKDLENYDKIRAILLYIFVENGTTQENLDRLIQHAKIESDGDVLKNWKYIGVPIVPKSTLRKPARRDRSREETFQLSRWTPVIKDVIEDHFEGKLDSKEWPYCSECPLVWNGSGAVSARQKQNTLSREERKPVSKLIIFVIGGITHSEIRSAYEVTQANKSVQVLIGSTHIATPKKMLDDIKDLTNPRLPKETFTLME